MQHAHISLNYYLPELSTDSALHYPTLPRGPPSATLVPTKMQLSEICEFLVNQKPTKLSSQLEVLELMFFADAQITIQAQTSKPRQNPKSPLKIRNLTSESQISPPNPKSHVKSTKTNNINLCFLFVVCCVLILLLLSFVNFWVISLAKHSFLCHDGKQQVRLLFMILFGKVMFCFSQCNSSTVHITCQHPMYLFTDNWRNFSTQPDILAITLFLVPR